MARVGLPSALLRELGRAPDRVLAERHRVPAERVRRCRQVRGIRSGTRWARHLEIQAAVLDAVRSSALPIEALDVAITLDVPAHVVRRHLHELAADDLVDALEGETPTRWLPVHVVDAGGEA